MKKIIFMILLFSYYVKASNTQEIFLQIQNEINLICNLAQEQVQNYSEDLLFLEAEDSLYNFWAEVLVEDLNAYNSIANDCKKTVINMQNNFDLFHSKIALQLLRNRIYALYNDSKTLKEIGIKKKSEPLFKTFYSYSIPVIDMLVKLSTITNASCSLVKILKN